MRIGQPCRTMYLGLASELKFQIPSIHLVNNYHSRLQRGNRMENEQGGIINNFSQPHHCIYQIWITSRGTTDPFGVLVV